LKGFQAISNDYETVGIRVAKLLLMEADSQSIDRGTIELFVQSFLTEWRKQEGYGLWIHDKDAGVVGMVSVVPVRK
jgi:hypothetical protein